MCEKAKERIKKGINDLENEIDKNLSKIIKDFEMAKEKNINYFNDDTLGEIEDLKRNITIKSGFEVFLDILKQ